MSKIGNCVSTAPVRANQGWSHPENQSTTKQLDLRTNTLKITFLLNKQRHMIRNLLVFNDMYEDFAGKTRLRKTTDLLQICDRLELNKNTFIDPESAYFDPRSCHLDLGI